MNDTDRTRTERPFEKPAPKGSWVPAPDETDHAMELHRQAAGPCEQTVVEVPRDDATLFALLDELSRGLEREQALSPPARAARAPQILAWFAPRYTALRAAAAAAPCAVRWSISLGDPAGDSIDSERHPCPDCFTQRYRAWKRARAGERPNVA